MNDGSTISGIQIVVLPEASGFNLIANGDINTGAAVAVYGELVESPGGKQKVRCVGCRRILSPWTSS